MVLFFCGLLLLGGFTFLVHERNFHNVVSHEELVSIRKKLKILSPQEKQDLAFFINQITLFDNYSYTLVGYKPMSICNVIIEDTEDLLPFWKEDFKRPKHQMLKRGYLVWKKYQSLFPSKNYIFVDYSFLGKGRREIGLICTNVCKDTIQNHLNDFQEILGNACSIDQVFWILTHPEHRDFYTLIENTRLVGILLGFGRNNAHLYEQYRGGSSRVVVQHLRSKQDTLEMFSDEWPWPGTKLSPNFACDPNTEETHHLKEHYKEACKIILWTYFLRDNLEVSLALLMKN